MAARSDLVKSDLIRVVVGWVLSLLLALVFFMAGGVKLLGRPALVHEFQQIGIGQWFRYFTGTLEVVGAVGVLIPRFSRWAALLLTVVMIGAIIAHTTILHTSPGLPIGLLVLAAVTAWVRR
jgi:uncharacterized membrane protein YphA (DoxX/SURF4 family)